MSSDKINRIQEYKACVARDCRNQAGYQLKIFFAKNPGWFCGSCKRYFQEEGLLISILQSIERSEGKDEACNVSIGKD